MTAVAKSTGLCNKLLGGSTGGKAQTLFALGFIKLYAGTIPVGSPSADQAISGPTLLGTYSVNHTGTGITFDDPVGGVLSKAAAETWEMVAVASGTATFARLVPATNTTGLSTTEARVQLTVGLGGDVGMIVGDTAIVSGSTYSLPTFSLFLTPQ